MKNRRFIILLALCGFTSITYSQNISKDSLIQDIRQLSKILETSHPDPYIKGGGKIAYQMRFHKLMTSIPDSGMTKSEFQKLLIPFVAAVGDGHTRIHVSYEKDEKQPGGIPLLFKISEKSLYVAGVTNPKDEYLLGSLLLSIENIPFKEIYARVTNLRGVDNEYGGLTLLEGKNYLWYKEQLHHLIPEWYNKNSIDVKLRLPGGEEKKITLNTTLQTDGQLITPATNINLPSLQKCDFNYCFLNNYPKAAILKINGMRGYRENFELVGLENEYQLSGAKSYYQRFNDRIAPENKTEIIQGLPSATETFKALVSEMKKTGAEILIIDLRENGGGNSVLGQILIYCLFGKDALIKTLSDKTGYEIKKFSKLYFEQNQNETLKNINEKNPVVLKDDDYWFEELYENEVEKNPAAVYSEFDDFYKKMPSFYAEYKTNTYSKYYCPSKIFVLCSPQTYSSGFTMMKTLNELGAALIGAPSSQGGNNAGWILNYKLDNTGLKGWVACKYYSSFSDKIKNGVYLPDFMLTYDKLSKNNFDPNAEINYVLEIIGK